jgi:hypothetical protein
MERVIGDCRNHFVLCLFEYKTVMAGYVVLVEATYRRLDCRSANCFTDHLSKLVEESCLPLSRLRLHDEIV